MYILFGCCIIITMVDIPGNIQTKTFVFQSLIHLTLDSLAKTLQCPVLAMSRYTMTSLSACDGILNAANVWPSGLEWQNLL